MSKDTETIADEIQEALDERLEWIKGVTKLGLREGPLAIRDSIRELDPEHRDSILYVLLLHYQAEAKRLQDLLERQALEADEDPILH